MKVDNYDDYGGGFSLTQFKNEISNEPTTRTLTRVIIQPQRRAKVVWFDSYGANGSTVWGHITPDDAEMLGLILVLSARRTREG